MIAPRKHGWIGIDFGTKVAKIAQLDRTGGRLRWHRAAIELSDNAAAGPSSGEKIRHALEIHGGFRGRSVACTLPMAATDLRPVTVPPGSEAERRAMIAQELDAVYGATDADREFDFWESDAPTTGGAGAQDSVNVLSVASSRVTELTDTLASAGLECVVLDGLPCALARAVSMAEAEAGGGPVAAIDWGYANATLSIVEQGRAQFTRLLRDCGAGALVKEVSQVLGLEAAEAADVLTRFGLPSAAHSDPEREEICEVVADVVGVHLQRMLDELGRTFSFLRLQRQALLPKRAWLFGAGATVQNMAPFLATKLETPCEVWRSAVLERDPLDPPGEELFGPAAALSALAWM